MFALSGIMLVLSGRRLSKQFDDRLVPYMGVLAAVVFGIQFVDIPVPPSSGHLMGSTLLAIMVGPWAAIIVIGLVLFVQALTGDGGLLTYGLNLFNMGIVCSLVGWSLSLLIFKALRTHLNDRWSVLTATAVASYVAVVVTAVVLGLEFFTVAGFGYIAFLTIVGVNAVIGVGEAIVTCMVLAYFVRARPSVISLLSGRKKLDVTQSALIGQKSPLD